MSLSRLAIIIINIYLIHHLGFAMTGVSTSPYYRIDDIAINCGTSGNSTGLDGRKWTGDFEPQGKSTSSRAVLQYLSADPVPYLTARISRSQFTYKFHVSPGQKFIRLHFYPSTYIGFQGSSKAFFSVKAGSYTLLNNFSPSLTADFSGVKFFAREFCVNVNDNQQALTIAFTPSPSTNSEDLYAFVNGIEIVSMPTGLYYTRDDDLGPPVVGNKNRWLYIDNITALEMVHRVNIGGRSILSVEDLGMFRVWSEDRNYLLDYGTAVSVHTSMMIKYINVPTYIAPLRVYQTAWSMVSKAQENKKCNLTWKLSVNLGFRYLIRLHFCELESGISEAGQREFSIFINNKMAEASADVIKWSGGNMVAVYKDYVVTMEGDRLDGKRAIIIALKPKPNGNSGTKLSNPILNGLEIFKLSNTDNNLAEPNPTPIAYALTSWTTKLMKLVLALGIGNVFANVVIIMLTLLSIIVYHLNRWGAITGEITTSSSDEEGRSRRFSFLQIQLATNNFDDASVIGNGGFGKVYRGLIDHGSKTVAIKRLKLESKQGAPEFWMEIEMLSTFQHIHLVSLVGYCDEGREMILVYEYMANGTLADHLYKIRRKGNGNGSSPLDWEQRLKICIGAARGLDYLHTGRGARHRLIHRDVKSSNILLDENWVAKISDFGLSKMEAANLSRTHISTAVKGTFGYFDPEYFMTHRLTNKSDVYSFGVVLLEVLCGRPAVDTNLVEEQRDLALWAQSCLKEGRVDQIVDTNVKDQISTHCLKVFVEIANQCLCNHSSKRPTMAEVVVALEGLLLALELPEEFGRHFSFEEIQLATNNFDDIIGKGGFGNVYRGLIDGGAKNVAIKRLKIGSKQGAHEFWTEIEALSTFQHIHLISLIGYCDEGREMILVYEYMAHGTLADHLYKIKEKGNACGVSPLDWEHRLKICIGAAHGLNYLHTARGERGRLIHRDVNSLNILLDENWVAKISDFGLSKMEGANLFLTHISTVGKGTLGYWDPEYLVTGRLTWKSDVYSFGVVLLEVLCGRRAVDTDLVEEQHSLALWAQSCIKEGRLGEIVDINLKNQISVHCLKEFAQLASKCLCKSPNERPTMAEVVAGLEFALEKQTRAYSDNEEEDINFDGPRNQHISRKKIAARKKKYDGSTRGLTLGLWWDSLWRRK